MRGWFRAGARWGLLPAMLLGCLGTAPQSSCQVPDIDLGGLFEGLCLFCPVTVPSFQYSCPSKPAGAASAPDASTDGADASLPLLAQVNAGSDLACVFPLAFGVFSPPLPSVAVGAPFGFVYSSPSAGDASIVTLPTEPAIDGVLTPAPQGWTFAQAGYLGFLVRQDDAVLDYTNILARDLASITLFSVDFNQSLSTAADAAPPDYVATAGSVARVVAFPRADDGKPLAGSFDCTFTSSDPALLSVESEGIVATLTSIRDGEVTLTATCAGRQAIANVHITASRDSQEAGDGSDAVDEPDINAPETIPIDAPGDGDAGEEDDATQTGDAEEG